jgi:hypothetical protein
MTGRPDGDHDDPSPQLDPPVPPELSAAWTAAEGQLFPSVLAVPDVYERTVLALRAALDRLRGLGTGTGPLLEASASGPALVAAAAERSGISTSGLDVALIAQVALAMRHREVIADRAASARLQVVRRARAEGRTWVVLEESGDWAGDPYVPYRRVEVHVPTGRVVAVTTTLEEDFRTLSHGVAEARLDLQTGAVVETDLMGWGPSSPPTTHADAADRERDVERRRAALGDG